MKFIKTFENFKEILISEHDGWRIEWNHSKEHDMYDRMERANLSLSFLNTKIMSCIEFLETVDFEETAAYAVHFKKSRFGIVFVYDLDEPNKIFILTILSDGMRYKDIETKFDLNEKFHLDI
jgi:hypothetical protein